MRAKTPRETETDILLQCGRRCCLCFGLHGDLEPKRGQIAHIDHDASNNLATNLAFLCLAHHDEYDSRTSQSKGFTIHELRTYRDRLVAKVCERIGPEQKLRELINEQSLEEELVCEATDRLEAESDPAKISQASLDRLRRLSDATNSVYEGFHKLPMELTEDDLISESDRLRTKFLLANSIPEDVYGVDGEAGPERDWFPLVEPLLKDWGRGILSRKQCGELHWELDERYDLDYYYVLYGIPHGILGTISIRYLTSFLFEFGSRNLDLQQKDDASDEDVPF